jgi:hyperosmotically inducible periplasmic protein
MSRLSLALLIAVLLTTFFPPQAAAAGRYDEQIQKDVDKYLQSKKEFQGIKATTDDQIVTLTGTVNLYIDKMNLEKKVRRIKNVDGVRNHVTVQSNVPDDQLRQTLADKLRYDRVGYGNVFNALGVAVKDGVVTLTGNVRDYPARDSAVAIAETTPGTRDVIDEIEVAPTSIFDDELRLKLYRAIYGQASLQKYAMDPQKPIRIVVNNGRVTLYGVVNNAMDKQIAGTQANSVPGVFAVDNQLLVANEQVK